MGEVNELQSFTIEFNNDLAPADLLDKWTTDEYVEFEPKIAGKFKWITPSTLIFSPDRALEPSQSYEAKVTNKVLFGKKGKVRTNKYDFNTPYFDAEGVDIFWTQIPHSNHKVTVQANITFNYEVEPKELRKYLEVKSGNNKVKDYQIVTEEASDIIAIDFGEIQQTKKEQQFLITIKKGCNSVLNKKSLAEDREFSISLPPITRLAITGVSSGFDGEKAWIMARTTQEVDKKQLRKYLKLKPSPADLEYSVSSNGFRIEGDFKAGSSVALTIRQGLPGLYGGTLENEYTDNILLANLEPKLRFSEKVGNYLMKGGLENVQVEAVNIRGAEVEVHEVFKNNLLFFLYDNYRYRDYYYDDYYHDYGNNYYVSNFGKKLYEEEIKFENLQNRREAATINLKPALKQRFKGIYVVNVRSKDDYWRRDAKIISISDIALLAKHSPNNELMVFANSIKTAKPIAGVKISLISTNNQTLVSGTTDEAGYIKFADIEKDVDGYSPRLITAEYVDDFNYIDLNATNVETSRYDVSGKYVSASTYDTYVYSDRNIYRPGETAHITGIVRDADINIIKDVPLSIKVLNPRGKTLNKYQKTLNAEGSFDLSVKIPRQAQTGQYIAELSTGDDEYITSYRFSVEEFMPDKIRVKVKKDKEIADTGDDINVDIESEYLFGSPAAGHKYEMDVRLYHRSYSSEKFSQYDFSNHSVNDSYLDNEFYEGKLDDDGKAEQTYAVPSDIEAGGYLDGRAYVSVFDVTGRTVNRTTNFKIFPKNYFVGLKTKGYYYGTNKDIIFDMVAVNKKDQLIKNFPAEIELIRYEWQTVLKKNNNGKYTYQSERKPIKEWRKKVTLKSGKIPFKFRTEKSGSHELRVYKKGSEDYVKTTFYSYSWGSATSSSFEINKEGQVDIILDKDEYQPGDRAKVLFVTPFTGRMLVTVEREKVIEHFYVDVEKNSTELYLKVRDEHLPNAYISATLFRPHKQDDNIPFLVGHGYANLKVEKSSNKLPVTIKAPERVRPRTKQTITVKAAPEKDIYVTLAAVDEGVLQIKNFQTPDPYKYMYGKRKLIVESHDMYKLLLPEVKGGLMSAPPGGDESGSKRLNPMQADRIKPLAKWSGIRRTNSRGEVTIPIEIPQYNGEVRLMAVAYQGKRFGSAEKPMKVSTDVVILPSVPRFLSIGDSLEIPVTVMNTTKKSGTVKVQMTVEGPLKVTSTKTKTVSLKASGSGKATFALETKDAVGVGKITFTTTGMDEVKEEIDISVRPISPLIVDSNGGSIKAGKSLTLDMPKGFLPGTQNTSLTISRFPAVQFADQLKYLVGYPHGCLEQTTSKLFPQLYFNELAALVAPDMYKGGNPVYFVKEGIQKLQGMLRYDGSYSYWPGGSYTNLWGSVYATHFLVEAKKGGFEVDEKQLNKALNHLVKSAKNKVTYDHITYSSSNQKTITKKARKETIYALYVLALAGKEDLSLMNYYRARPHLLTQDTRYLLAGSFAQAENWSAYNELLPNSFSEAKAKRTSGGSFDSDIRANAIMLNVLLDVDPTNKQIPVIINHLSKKKRFFYSTQERAWAFLGLGKAAKQRGKSEVKIDVVVDGKTIKKITEPNYTFSSKELNGKKVVLKATGTGTTYYFWNTEGIKIRGVAKEEDQGIQVRRTYYDRNGTAITSNRFKQGDLIVCKVSLTASQQSVQNIAISDLVPSGFEIENPRLTRSADLAWVSKTKNKFRPDYLDVRDDRLILFTSATSGTSKSYYYLLRVVNTGKFQLPAIGADAMYDPNYRSYNGGGTVAVAPL